MKSNGTVISICVGDFITYTGRDFGVRLACFEGIIDDVGNISNGKQLRFVLQFALMILRSSLLRRWWLRLLPGKILGWKLVQRLWWNSCTEPTAAEIVVEVAAYDVGEYAS
jgi:hypothetical protein